MAVSGAMELLAQYGATVSPDYGQFGLRDAWCDAGDDGESYRDAQDQVASATYQLTVRTPSDPLRVGLELPDMGRRARTGQRLVGRVSTA